MEEIMLFWGLFILGIIVVLWAQFNINSNYKKFSKIKVKSGLSGQEVARKILDANGLQNIHIVETQGELSDHYDPRRKVIRLSRSIFHEDSISSVGVAAHECGHAIQDKEGYTFMRIRSAIIPFVNFGTRFGYIAVLVGLIFGATNVAWIGVGLLLFMLLFQLVTLPVELNASSRAKQILVSEGIITSNERKDASNMLTAAALTYVASLISTIFDLLRLVLIIIGNDRD